ncbi:MAG: potassium channel protein [Candidatus Koribacter versatilis]|uniref:Potassium channel protein n=1 Tax=Candidatus Korobacter versatilis TaxID=658062 RepID=A0A932EN64_9BACT|nr:potassium channel protein [Candidatus Koribacter versatilis]
MDLRRRLQYAVVALLTITAFSVAGYRLLGGTSVTFLQAVYMAVITLAGVGYGEIIDTSHNPALRIFNMFVVLFGVTITVYVFSVVTAFLVEGEITNIFWRRKMQKKIGELKNHYIICGLGDTGRFAVDELQKTGTDFVVIEGNLEVIKKFREHHTAAGTDNVLIVPGDATDEEVMDQAGMDRARGLIAALSSDKDNLVIIVMARQRRDDIRIVARYTDPKFADRMIKAGANSTVSPNRIGGLRLASEALRPHVVGFLDLMLREQSRTLRIEDLEINAGSPWIGQTIAELKMHQRYNLLVMAVKNVLGDNKFIANPTDNLRLTAGSVLIAMGDVNDIRRARQECESHATATTA